MAVRKISEYPEEVLGKMGQPVTKFDEAGPPHVVPAEKTALTAASLGAARPSAAIASAASQPPMYLPFVKSGFPSCPARR